MRRRFLIILMLHLCNQIYTHVYNDTLELGAVLDISYRN